MLFLEQDITRKEQVDQKITRWSFGAGDSKKYKFEAIWDSAVYVNKIKGYLPGLYYLIAWK